MPTNLEAAATTSVLSSSMKRKEDGNRLFAKKIYSAAVACYRAGLDDLPPYDKIRIEQGANNNNNNNNATDAINEIINLEVGLRSNIALALLKLAEEKQQPPLPGGVATNNPNEVRKLYVEIEQECNIGLQLDSMNPKLYHRRGLARQYFAEQLQCASNESDDTEDEVQQQQLVEDQWKLAEKDFSCALDVLKNENEQQTKQIADACKVLENLRLTKKKSQTMKEERNTSLEKQQQQSFIPLQIQSNGHTKQLSENSDGVPPSPQAQRDYILQLLSRCTTNPPIINGEAYFLINMDWWQSWCCYVGLFSMYTGEGGNNTNNGRSQTQIKQHCRQIDISNQQVLQLLPPGATLPPYLEQDRNLALRPKTEEKKKKSVSNSDSSTSSDDSDDDDEFATFKKSPPRPGAIDNASLILPHNNEGWCCTIESAQLEQQIKNENQGGNDSKDTSSVLLRNHLVRGYHYELLPREAYGALRTWYGESSPHIVRRVVVNDADDGTSNTQQRVELYSEHWDVISRRSSSLSSGGDSSNNTSLKCSACGSPTGKSSCQRCGVARYCNRKCQVNHWTYHKKMCSTLNKRKEEGSLEADNNSSNVVLDSAWGRVGLNNLGNTCFLNSAMQCMMHVAPLTRYFLSDRYSVDINTHNILGTGGKVAKAYSAVLRELWMGSHQYQNVSPTALKRAIELFAPQFSGASQQDSAELITYLLDALHEDLNRVKNPPYVEMPDVDLGRKLSISGAEAWQLSCLRNDSFVYDNFYGLYKSKCVCPLCNKVTVKFDPFNHITLEIPQQPLRHIAVLLIRDCAETGPQLPTKYCVSLPNTANIYSLKEKLSEVTGVSLERLCLCDVDFEKHGFRGMYNNDQQPISVIPQVIKHLVVAYEIAPLDDKTQIHCALTHFAVDSNLVDVGGINRRPIGVPIFLSFDPSLSCAQIYDKILMYVISFAKIDSSGSMSKEALRSNLRIRIENEGLSLLIPSDAKETLPAILGDVFADSIIHLIELEWVDIVGSRIHLSNFRSAACHPSYLEQEKKLGSSDPSSVSLYECFESFTQPERLDDENMLYCSGCKKHVQAMKTVTLWRIPKILVVHLKRFEYRGTFNRSKIGVLVDFPLDGLDLDSHSPQSSVAEDDFVDDHVPMMYDLFGVVNHYGRMGYGHYTAHARRWDETGAEREWAEFDDENVTGVADTDSIVSPAAYVLFYKRRLFL